MFKKNHTNYEAYIDLGKAGGTFSEFYKLLPESYQRSDAGGKYAGDKNAVQNYAMGLILGGHLDKFRYLYKREGDMSSAAKVIEAGLRAAVYTKNLYLFEEIKGMTRWKTEDSFRLSMDGYSDSKRMLDQFDALITRVNPPYDLINDINNQIKKVEIKGGHLEPWFGNDDILEEKWNDKTSRYPDKYRVLTEIKKYLLGASDINQLRKVVEDNPKYDKGGVGRTETGKLLDKALELKGATLTATLKHK